MLSLCLSLSVLLGLQVAGTGAHPAVLAACKRSICSPLKRIIKYETYEEHHLPPMRWLSMFVRGADMPTAIEIAHINFLKYFRYHNDAHTIVPLGIPWTVFTPFIFDFSIRDYMVSISLPAVIVDPPAPTDSSLQLLQFPEVEAYVRTFTQNTVDYQNLIDEFKRDLENDNRSFNSTGLFINWYNRDGLMQIVITK